MQFLKLLVLYTFFIGGLLKFPALKQKKTFILALAGMAFTAYFIYKHLPSTISIAPYYFLFLILFWVLSIYWPQSNLALICILLVMTYLRVEKAIVFWGFSYLALRLIWLNLEIKHRQIKPPNIFEYLAFVFYFPSMATGPFFSFNYFKEQLNRDSVKIDYYSALLRALWGVSKMLVLASSIHPLVTSQMMLDGYRHSLIDFIISLVSYYLYLYLKFSGSIDVLLAASSVLGINLPENFDKPFKATSISEFWSRWHITLGNFLRFVVFFPLQRKLVSRLPKLGLHMGAISLGITMFLMGLWHGIEFNYLIYGGMHGLALILHYYYSNFKKRENLGGMQKNFGISLAWLTTHSFVAVSLLFVDNSLLDIEKIWSALVIL